MYSNNRGGALLISLLVLLAMTSLGLLAVTTSTVGITLAGNYKAQKRAEYLAEAGLMLVADHLTRNPYLLTSTTSPGSINYDPAIAGDTGPTGAATKESFSLSDFGPDAVFMTSGAAADMSTGYDARPIDFQVTIDERRDLPACPGFSTNALCCKRVTLTSEGRVGDFTISDQNSVGNARRKIRAQYLIPYPCTK